MLPQARLKIPNPGGLAGFKGLGEWQCPPPRELSAVPGSLPFRRGPLFHRLCPTVRASPFCGQTIAARRSGVRTLIFPAANRHDFEELDSGIKEGLEVHFVETYDEVFAVAFPDLN